MSVAARRRPPLRIRVSSQVTRMDGPLLVAAAGLSAIGVLLVWSSTRLWNGAESSAFASRHLMNIAIGVLLLAAATLIDVRWLRTLTPVFYLVSMLGLVLVLTPLGGTANGSNSWIVVGGFQLQPSEFAKPALVLMMAMLLSRTRENAGKPRIPDLLFALGAAVLPMGLVMMQPDLGTTLVLIATTAGLLVLAGIRKLWIFLLIAVSVSGAAAVWFLNLLEPYQVARFTAFLDPSTDPRGVGYNSTQSLIAVGSGELFGKGLFHGGQTTGRFVPEQHTDFVFTVAGEELGFIGAVTIVALLGVILLRGLKIARESGDRFCALVAGGVVCWFGFQTFINVGMTIGVMPITGLPLPFVSYGGTATFANMIAIGLLQAMHIRDRTFT
ncbi:rod shape-determining protein RodA [Rhizohabitans arisaemae]|uniref:rod shape-determining protein RodA n=1 Tax=Rhizohabitans arisaemae TaxID=2720610 RepID=UPI0024B23F99|nr:rod shape-determining protein RodA [Rhizohabitans arisaemae]